MKKGIIFTGLLLLLGKLTFAQQDAQYSQYMFNGIYINPAYAGYKEVLNVHAFYRAQWTGIEGAPRSFSVAVDAIANEGNVGLALQLSSDKLGAQSTQGAYASYAYRIRLNANGSSRLAFGLSGGLVQLGINGALLSSNDPELDMPAGTQSTLVPDARAGVFFSNDRLYAGFSVDNLIAPHMNKSHYIYIPQPKPHYYLTAGMLLPVSEAIQFKPSFLLRDDRGGPTSIDLNAFLLFKDKIWVGGSYRTGLKLYDKDYLQKVLMKRNAAVAAIEIFPVNNLRVGYAYDFSVGPLESYSHGSHEISIGYSFSKPDVRMATPRVF
ncbi:MAG TPA: type IX secretion system membrane protein PorP/SprF [Chitinophaga sp.]|uniref:PorP/SprF family type IX secretion system membrane protein n=1 Tax=Chitinophaga sp. TaxID=1869181 RepID=UPI002DB8BF2B|nr:type IX secretion system membrane protein PorP/SprF [Chitinophaga sp.]HEU4553430.1 type IX secretion system membrane protein PorP/SprF [Chitinophaga sp.]